MICSRIAPTWLRKLGFVYKKICKDIFIDGYKRLDEVKDYNVFLTQIEELKPYIVKFDENGLMKA